MLIVSEEFKNGIKIFRRDGWISYPVLLQLGQFK